jgi:hypothetical protein
MVYKSSLFDLISIIFFKMKRKVNQENRLTAISPRESKRIKIDENSNVKTFSSELIIEIFKYLVLDLFRVEYDKFYDIKIRKRSDPLLPLNVIKNMMLTSKEYKNLFEICFKEMFVEEFNVDLRYDSKHLLKNVIYSSILYTSSLRMYNRLLMLDGNYFKVCEIGVHEKSMNMMFKSIGCYRVFHELFYVMTNISDDCYCSICKSIDRDVSWRNAKNIWMIG